MAVWTPEEYTLVARQLRKPEDVDRLSRSMGVERDVLWSIYSQERVRKMMFRHRKMVDKGKKLLERWKNGSSIVEIADAEDFAPALMARILLQAMGTSQKRTRKIMKDPSIVDDERLRKEIMEAIENDDLYSPDAHEEQAARGIWGEERLFEWLDSKGWEYVKQDEMSTGEGVKTPDALFRRSIEIAGHSVRWIDSKALFGDPYEIKRGYQKQFKPYIERFGPGAVVYWFGYVRPEREWNGLLIIDESLEEL